MVNAMTVRLKFAKILSHNDLGLTGSHQSGILVPRSSPLATLIPQERRDEVNPRRILTPILTNISAPVTSSLIFYNNKARGGTRDEFRLTRTRWLVQQVEAQPGDVLEFIIEDDDLVEVTLTTRPTSPGPIPWTHGWSPKGWR